MNTAVDPRAKPILGTAAEVKSHINFIAGKEKKCADRRVGTNCDYITNKNGEERIQFQKKCITRAKWLAWLSEIGREQR